MNRLYEGMFLLDANETAKRWDEMESHIGTLLGRIGGDVQYSERWPSQRLAYDVKGVRKGTYYLTYFTAPPDRISDLRRDAELSEHILRLLVIQEDWLEEEMNRRQTAAAARPVVEEPRTTEEAATTEAATTEAATTEAASTETSPAVAEVEAAKPGEPKAEAAADSSEETAAVQEEGKEEQQRDES